jgi:hypothetical protein
MGPLQESPGFLDRQTPEKDEADLEGKNKETEDKSPAFFSRKVINQF